MNYKFVTLINGVYNGTQTWVYHQQPYICMPHGFTHEEQIKYGLDKELANNWPSDLYVLNKETEQYVFEKTIYEHH